VKGISKSFKDEDDLTQFLMPQNTCNISWAIFKKMCIFNGPMGVNMSFLAASIYVDVAQNRI